MKAASSVAPSDSYPSRSLARRSGAAPSAAALLCIALTRSTLLLAACSSIPDLKQAASGTEQSRNAVASTVATSTTTTTTLAYGQLGSVNVPFVPPDSMLQIERGKCDTNGTDFPATTPPHTIVLIDPNSTKGTRRIFLIEPPNGCGSVDACRKGVNGKKVVDVRCFPMSAQDYYNKDVRTLVIRSFPDLATLGSSVQGPRTGSMKVAVTSTNDLENACAALADKDCQTIIKDDPKGWHACVDKLVVLDDDCNSQSNQVFPDLTLLPRWNDLHRLCFADRSYCNGLDAELRYTLDANHNVLVPMYWGDSLAKCPPQAGKICGLTLTSQLVPPSPINVPINDSTTTSTSISTTTTGSSTTTTEAPCTNTFLQSFRTDGSQITRVRFCADAAMTGAIAFAGRADDLYSVLRFPALETTCAISHKRCMRHKDCRADLNEKCKSGNAFHDLRDAFAGNGWRFNREDPDFCEANPPKDSCKESTAGCLCIGYQVFAGPAVYLDRPADFVAPELAEFARVLHVQGRTDRSIVASASSDALIAGFLSATPAGSRIASALGCEPKEGLVFSKFGCGGPGKACEPECAQVGPVEAREGLAVFEGKVRFFAPDPERSTKYKLLKVYDQATGLLTPVARVDTSDKRYSALRQDSNGATLFLSPAGRCVADGAILPVPPLCTPPDESGECPRGSSCEPATVVVATDLETDIGGDGVPDVLAGLRISSKPLVPTAHSPRGK